MNSDVDPLREALAVPVEAVMDAEVTDKIGAGGLNNTMRMTPSYTT